MKIFFLFILLIFNFCNSYSQNYYDSLKIEYESLVEIGKTQKAIFIARSMLEWSAKNEGDTSLRLAESYKYLGILFNETDSSLKYFNLSKLLLELQDRIYHPDYAANLNNLGMIYQKIGNYDTASIFYLKALHIFKNIYGIENLKYAKVLNNLGDLYSDLKEFKSAERHYRKSLDIKKIIVGEMHTEYAISLNNLGSMYEKKGNYDSALKYYYKALLIVDKVSGSESEEYVTCANNLAAAYSNMGKYKHAEQFFRKVLKIREHMLGKLDLNYAESLYNIGNLYIFMGYFKSAEPYLKEALQIRKYNLDYNNYDIALNINTIGVLYASMGDYKSAEKYIKESSDIIKNIFGENHIEYAVSLTNLGFLFKEMRNYKSAEKCYKISLDINKNILGTEHPDYATCLNNLGNLYSDLNNFNAAETFYMKSLKIREKTLGIKHPDYAESLNNIGNLYSDMHNYKLALTFYKNSINIKRNTMGTRHPSYAASLNNLANLYSRIRHTKNAKIYYKRSLHILKKIDMTHTPDYALILNNIGVLYSDLNENKIANQYYTKSLDIRRKIYGTDHPVCAESLVNVAILYKELKKYNFAASYFSEAFRIKLINLKNNISWLSLKEKEIYWDVEKEFFNLLINILVNTHSEIPYTKEFIYNSSLISKNFILETTKDLDKAIIESKSDTLLQKQFLTMKQSRFIYTKLISENSNKIDLINFYKNQADSLDKILVNKLGEYAAAKQKFEITWKDVQDSLQYNHAAIEFARYYDDKDTIYKYMALVVRPGYTYPKLMPLGSETAIKKAVKSKNFPSLYNLVWKDIDTLLNGVNTIYYSPAGELNNVAFSALCYNNRQSSSTCNTYLLDKYSLHQLTTTRYLADGTLKKSKPLKTEIALFGGINYDVIPKSANSVDTNQSNESYVFEINLEKQKQISGTRNATYSMGMPYLEGTRVEVGTIGSMMNKNKWTVETRTDTVASEHDLKKLLQEHNPGVLHIATHGFAFAEEVKKEKREMMVGNESNYRVSEDPMVRCGLMLGGSNISWTGQIQKMVHETGEDGILTAAEVANMDLRGTKLAVLSACETGLGQIESTEGTFGLKRGFKLAGVEQIIVSLWSVPDKETMEMMNLFYSDLAITGDPVISFEKSQKAMRDRYPTQPTKWAGFVLVR
jgi:tetratricopeptide (TPR) repeat protein/CHAT domain-containing protein